MGDRANIVIIDNEQQDPIYFYTHWTGTELPHILQDALKRGKSRWDDFSYLSRIIFSEMVKDDLLDTTGYGISTFEVDGNNDIKVDMDAQKIELGEKTYTFEEYIALPKEKLVWYEEDEEED